MVRISTKIITYILAVWSHTLVNTQSDEETLCDIVIGEIGYEREVINDEIDRPGNIAIDYATNTLFFSHKNSNDIVSRYVDLNTKIFGDIAGIKGGFAHTVDNQNHVVYIGGQDGIYTFDYKTKTGSLFGAKNMDIYNIFYKNKLYFVTYPTKKLYTLENGQAKAFEELKDTKVEIVAVDKDNNVFINNSTGLYRFDKDFKESKFFGDYAIDSITSDNNGNIYFSTANSLNKIESDSVKVLIEFRKVSVFGIAVDADGTIIYPDDNKVYRLKSSKTKCTENN